MGAAAPGAPSAASSPLAGWSWRTTLTAQGTPVAAYQTAMAAVEEAVMESLKRAGSVGVKMAARSVRIRVTDGVIVEVAVAVVLVVMALVVVAEEVALVVSAAVPAFVAREVTAAPAAGAGGTDAVVAEAVVAEEDGAVEIAVEDVTVTVAVATSDVLVECWAEVALALVVANELA